MFRPVLLVTEYEFDLKDNILLGVGKVKVIVLLFCYRLKENR